MGFTLKIITATLIFVAVFMLNGCTDQERRGLSPIPQNRPANWEYNPYGQLQN